MRPALLALLVLVVACTRVTQANYARIEEGMTEQQVLELLGPPTEASGGSLLGVSGTTSRWATRDAAITVQIVNGRAVAKTYEQPPK